MAQIEKNQQVPGSPAFSPLLGRRSCAVFSSPHSHSPIAHVPEAGSPLLRQLLNAGRKRQREQDSPSQLNKKIRHSPVVPHSVVTVQQSGSTAVKASALEQVVPSQSTPEEEREEHIRKLPDTAPKGTKPFELFSGDIFASHEE